MSHRLKFWIRNGRNQTKQESTSERYMREIMNQWNTSVRYQISFNYSLRSDSPHTTCGYTRVCCLPHIPNMKMEAWGGNPWGPVVWGVLGHDKNYTIQNKFITTFRDREGQSGILPQANVSTSCPVKGLGTCISQDLKGTAHTEIERPTMDQC